MVAADHTAPEPATGTRLLREGVRIHRGRLVAATALMSVHQLCEVAVPVLIGVMVDRAIATTDPVALSAWIGVLAAVFVTLTISYRLGARAAMQTTQDEAHRLRMRCAESVLTRVSHDPGRRSGDVLSIANSDADETGNLLRFVPQTGSAVAALAACAVALLSVDVVLGVIVLIGVPLALSLVQIVTPIVTRRVGTQQHHIGRATAIATDLITGLRPLRGIRAESVAALRYRAVNDDARTAMQRAAIGHGTFFGTATGVTGVLAVAVATLTGWFALTDRISVGALIAVLGLAQFLTEPLALLAMFPGRVATARASAARVASVIGGGSPSAAEPSHAEPSPAQRLPDRQFSGRPLPDAVPDIHSPHGPVIDIVDEVGEVRVADGELVVVTAPTARSAQRVVELLGGVQKPHDGRAAVSGRAAMPGRDASDLPTDVRPGGLLVEPHRVDLFTGTIGDNLTLGRAAIDRRDALDLLRAMGSRDIIDGALPAGDALPTDGSPATDDAVTRHADADVAWSLPVADRGQSLSGGQRQRLALSRALLTDPAVLVLHEPTTAVDSVTESTIARVVHARRHGVRHDRTTVVVTTSPAWAAVADRVVATRDIPGGPDQPTAPESARSHRRADR
ncbi:ABC transporter ATP-binding protein [Gordonia sp. ABSL11-1]|uniref:ABC transporter transmembrane domain-containing protein n=1 Tax=Gordonia sp. ABSL11-1 TaxID=3053924 RepID=UPI0025748CAE|nr:ABC transporter ATP-binding protein [Gordonia sp. ABSL11-1]MDL9944054.1 ABC transporter ATP-binding protein [Gordonia sp. ABSL11-1]